MIKVKKSDEPFVEALESAVFNDTALPELTREYIHDAKRDELIKQHLEHAEGRKHRGEK